MDERRRHVRAKPVPELPARVLYELMPPITEALDVLDISVGGLAITQATGVNASTERLKLRLVLPDGTFAIEGKVRWIARGMVGLELVDPPQETTRAIQRYVGELLERGSSA
jgi:c-di-GMP-binding flagellar brake protein YcgR